MSARYNRVLDPEVESMLAEDGELRFLITDAPELSPNDPYALDIQIREGNQVMYYNGTTRVLTLQFRRKYNNAPVTIKASAAAAYGNYEESEREFNDLMKEKKVWSLFEIPEFKLAWQAYLKAAIKAANDRYYKNGREGFWQNRLCVEFGRNWTPSSDWLVIDRECVIGFDNSDDKTKHYEKAFKPAMSIKGALQASDSKKWGNPDKKGFGDEVDMLAIDKSGDLIVIELKHGVNTAGIYWGPLQAGVYHAAFKDAPPEVLQGIQCLIAQKIKLGLLPDAAAKRVSSSLKLGDPVLAIAEPKKKSHCWGMMIEVLQKTKNWPMKIALIRLKNDHCIITHCEADGPSLMSCIISM